MSFRTNCGDAVSWEQVLVYEDESRGQGWEYEEQFRGQEILIKSEGSGERQFFRQSKKQRDEKTDECRSEQKRICGTAALDWFLKCSCFRPGELERRYVE